MKFLRQFMIILLLSFLGEVLKMFIPLPIPASVYGLVLMLACLMTGVLKTSQVKDAAFFLIEIMPVMFIPAAAGLIDSWGVLRPLIVPIMIITVAITVFVMVVTGSCLLYTSIDDLEAGHREIKVTGEEGKKDPLDFVLWKPKKEGEIAWDSPWGEGRPGWHIECSEMSKKYIGDTIDIHAGGEDLIFPHHENEIAQSEACNEEKFANYWMHNGFLNINNKKMSKSAGNFFTVREIGEKYPLQVIRFFMLSAHYRTPLNFSDTLVESAKTGLAVSYTHLA